VLASVVNYRSHPRQSHLLPPVRPTPLFPSPPLTPLLPISYSPCYRTATPQPFCHQSLTRSFPHDGGCTPLSSFLYVLAPSNPQKPKFPVVDPHSIQQLTKCSSRNPFLSKNIHFDGGCTPLPSTVFRSILPTGSGRSEVQTIHPCAQSHRRLPSSACTYSLCYARSPLGGRHE
jgi:hypothetical protein